MPESSVTQCQSLEQLLDLLLAHAEENDQVTIGSTIDALGSRAFGPLVLLVGLITMSPLSGIPSLPSVLGITIMLLASQMLMSRTDFWLPPVVLQRSISSGRLVKAVNWVRPVGLWMDRVSKPRFSFLTRGPGAAAILVACCLYGITMPPLELLPFVASAVGVVLTIFGVALLVDDGFLAMLAWMISGLVVYLGVEGLIS